VFVGLMRLNWFSGLIQNQDKMTRFECLRARDDCGACCDVFSLFSQLGIPPQEQTVLWNLANKKIGCKNLRNILVLLQRK
jgi:hypothetical protein